ncbi:MAG: hypothetical protein AAFX54_00665 [Pseudomonadota bacterium]
MTAPATAAQTRINKLIRITEALGEIFAQENRLIRDNRADEITPLQSKKKRLATEYMQSIRELAQDRTDIEGAESNQLAQLRSLALTLEERAVNQCTLVETPAPKAAAS